MKGFWELLNKIIIIALTVAFIRWYFKGHFGKYFILFWLFTIVSIIIMVNHKKPSDLPHDNRTGAEVWEEQYGKVN